MRSPAKILCIVPLISCLPLWAAQNGEQAALTQYIRDRMGSSEPVSEYSKALKEGLPSRVEALEGKLFPFTVRVKRVLAEFERRSLDLDRQMQALEGGRFKKNPYEDPDWRASSVKSAIHLCCKIRSSPKLQSRLAERAAAGLPLLIDGRIMETDSDSSSESGSGRSRRRSKKGGGENRIHENFGGGGRRGGGGGSSESGGSGNEIGNGSGGGGSGGGSGERRRGRGRDRAR